MYLLCLLGLHWPLREFEYICTDQFTGHAVYEARCSCGLYWLTWGRWGLKERAPGG